MNIKRKTRVYKNRRVDFGGVTGTNARAPFARKVAVGLGLQVDYPQRQSCIIAVGIQFDCPCVRFFEQTIVVCDYRRACLELPVWVNRACKPS